MYIPAHFEQTRQSQLHALVRAYPLATLVAGHSGGLNADHIPLLLVDSGGPLGALHGHVARANPLWRMLREGSEALAIFQGPNRYISPSWYPSKEAHGKVVPTWNYLAVHARGQIRWHDDPAWLHKHLETATETYEDSARPWRLSDAPTEFVAQMISAIVGFEIRIAGLEGKWKLGQNRSEQDQRGVAAELKKQRNSVAADMLRWMEDNRSSD